MDASISETEIDQVKKYLDSLKEKDITYHSLMTRQAGQRKFISFHLLVPGAWTVQQGHENADIIEETIEDMFDEPVTVTSHIEPVEDPASLKDIGIDRKKNS
jgi:divalent metal cation (Fe/Co/Zn/Cd) transporter